ncbi:MAG: DUF3772 domain-containing protein, partial [Alphaproteobacteria bacterium]
MTIRRTWLALGRHAVCLAIAGAFLVSATVLDRPAQAQAQSSEPPSLESIKSSLDEIEAGVDSEDVTPETLARFRQTLNTATETLRAQVDELEPRVRELEERVKQLGPTPAKDAPPESADIASQREELTKQFGELDGELKQAKVLSLRADQLSERVSQKRHSLYARELFARTPSVLDPFFWMDTLRAFPIELRAERAVFNTWIGERGDRLQWSAAVLITLGIIAVAIALSRWWFPRLLAHPMETRSAKAWAALWVFVWFTGRTPLATAAALLTFEAFGLLTARVEQIAEGLLAGVAAASFGYGVARGLFAPWEPQRRLVQEDDATALCYHNHLVWSARALAVLIVSQVAHKTLFAPLIVTVATNALFAAVTAAFLAHLVVRLRQIRTQRGDALVVAAWVHPLGLLLAVLIALALVVGYAGLAAFVALRVIVA